MRGKGAFIVLEGTDGSGKTEQFSRLVRRLRDAHIPLFVVDFPRYGHPAAYFAERYLRGEYGSWNTVNPRAASLFYALDRFDAAEKIRAALRAGNVVVANRYVASNMGHQGAKIAKRPIRPNLRAVGKARSAFIQWVHELEYGVLSIPKPDLNIFLQVPPAAAFRLIAKKGKREYLRGKRRDVHEADIRHIRAAAEAYGDVIRLYPREYVRVDCAPRGRLRSREAIAERVWAATQRVLEAKRIRIR